MKKILTKMRHSMGILTTLKDEEAGLFVPNRQVSWIVAGTLFLGFLFFMLGYFWGHRRALDRFVAKIEEESFADRINYALYTMNDRDISEFEQETEDVNGVSTSPEELAQTNDEQEENGEEQELSVTAAQAPSQHEQSDDVKKENTLVQESQPVQAQASILFVAPLAGFGTLHAATEFIQRVQLVDPSSVVEKRTSKTSKGRAITWYQATTGTFEKKEDLEKIVNVIRKKEHIKDIKIVEKRKG